jgi:hypothetical protein
MSAPPPKSRVIVHSTSRRDLFIALGCGLAVLLFVVFGIWHMSREQGAPSTNELTGKIVAKHDSGEKVTEITYGKRGLNEHEADSGFSFDIRVESENRTYEVPVAKALYDAKKVGDEQSFIRPPSDQR